ncbi:MAG: hypothetical protein JWL83_1178 [Actinomycetia bacterium]|jgi:hypothetical protein|nr:hypothetical protein [Actinomycetes bacterium]
MDDVKPPARETMSPSRLAQFEAEVTKMRVSGGGANPERTAARVGIGLTVLGFVVAFISWWSAYNAGTFEDIHRAAIFALIGVGMALVGAIIWLRNSLTRYLRYWIIRLVYEQREQTDRLLERRDNGH